MNTRERMRLKAWVVCHHHRFTRQQWLQGIYERKSILSWMKQQKIPYDWI